MGASQILRDALYLLKRFLSIDGSRTISRIKKRGALLREGAFEFFGAISADALNPRSRRKYASNCAEGISSSNPRKVFLFGYKIPQTRNNISQRRFANRKKSAASPSKEVSADILKLRLEKKPAKKPYKPGNDCPKKRTKKREKKLQYQTAGRRRKNRTSKIFAGRAGGPKMRNTPPRRFRRKGDTVRLPESRPQASPPTRGAKNRDTPDQRAGVRGCPCAGADAPAGVSEEPSNAALSSTSESAITASVTIKNKNIPTVKNFFMTFQICIVGIASFLSRPDAIRSVRLGESARRKRPRRRKINSRQAAPQCLCVFAPTRLCVPNVPFNAVETSRSKRARENGSRAPRRNAEKGKSPPQHARAKRTGNRPAQFPVL